MTYALACYQSDIFAAAAPIAGMMTGESLNQNSDLPCAAERPMPIIHIHGTDDYSVPIEFGEEAVAFWSAFNNTTQHETTSVEGTREIERHSYTDGDNDISVEYYKVIGGYHETFDNINYEGSNSLELIWNFFSQYDINGRR